MVDRYLGTGCRALDELLGGGFLRRRINTVYGDAGTGKTTLMVQMVMDVYRGDDDRQAFFYLDTEAGLCDERFDQLAGARGLSPEEVLERIPKPREAEDLRQQRLAVTKRWPRLIEEKGYRPELFAVDSFVGHYQGRIMERPPSYRVLAIQNLQGSLSAQLVKLQYLADVYDVPAIVVSWTKSRVSQVFAERKEREMFGAEELSDIEVGLGAEEYDLLGGRRLCYISKVILRLMMLDKNEGTCAAILEKHIARPTGRVAFYRLTERGVEDVPEAQVKTVHEYFKERMAERTERERRAKGKAR